MGRTLKSNVAVNNRWYGPAHGNADAVPADVAEQITNPAAWADVQEAPQETSDAPERPRKSSRRSS